MTPRTAQDYFPLSPLQQGMLFHSLSEPTGGAYIEQLWFVLEGLDRQLFRRAWELVATRYPVLRTAVVGAAGKNPTQVTWSHVDLAWHEHDCRGLSPQAQQEWIARFIEDDRTRGFRFNEPSLFRFMLVRCGERDYEFIWTNHHMMLDGWSGSMLRHAVFECYEALVRGEQPALTSPRPFSDFIAWQHEQDTSGAEAYWRERLAGRRGPTRIGSSARSQDSDHQTTRKALPLDVTAALRQQAARCRVTLNTLVQGAWALLLSRYSGERDVVFGTVVSGRPEDLVGVESMVGMFLNTLPFRADVAADVKLGDWLRTLQEQQLEQRSFEHTPLWQIKQWSGIAADTELFDSLYVFENFPLDATFLEQDRSLRVTAKPTVLRIGLPLHIMVWPLEQMTLQLICDASRFAPGTADQLLEGLATLLEAFTGDPDQRLGDLRVLRDRDRRRLLIDWNDTAVARPREQCLHQLFEQQAARTPERVAVVAGEDSASYAELNAAAEALAARLQQAGVVAGTSVALYMTRDLHMVVAILAVLKAGGCYVPLDPGYPRDRIKFILGDTGATVVLAQHALLADARALAGAGPARPAPVVICVDQAMPQGTGDPTPRPRADSHPGHTAYVIHTSGSTGRPKGVVISHRSAVALMHWARSVYDDDELAGVLAATSICFDLSVFELFVPLSWGGAVILAGDALALPELPARPRVTLINTVPSAAAELLRQSALPASVRTVNLAGEPLAQELVEQIYAAGVARVMDLYGPSEDTTYSTAALREAHGVATIGRPIENEQAYILDQRGEPVPVGVVGELFLGGSGLATGYLNRPGLTAARFVPDPFSGVAGARLYRTGDLVRYRPDGNIVFLGRADQQVKLRGFRIELGEIEAVLAEHADIEEAVAAVREDRAGDPRLVAYVVPAAGRTPVPGGVQAFLAERLPDYMLPQAMVTLAAIPRTANGKTDRKSMPAPQLADRTTGHVAPRDGIEEVLCAIWQDILGTPQIGVHDDFFDLGGHSLLATQVVSRVRAGLHRELPVRSVFEHPTIADLAAVVTGSDRDTDGIAPAERNGALPLSFAQQRLWFLDQLGVGATYNMPGALRLEGKLDRDALQRGIDALVERHEILRTRFPALGGVPEQRILDSLHIPLRDIDLTGLPAERREDEARARHLADAQQPFDLQHGPLLRAALVRLGDADHLLFLNLHHIVFDAWSLAILGRDLSAFYAEFSGHRPATLPRLTIQYADFASWQTRWLEGEQLTRQLRFWRAELASVEPLELPTDRPRGTDHQSGAAACHFALDSDTYDALHALGRRHGVTPAMVLLAAFNVLLSRYTGQRDLVVASPIANRNRHEVENLIGFFVNTLALRTDCTGDPTFLELLDRVRDRSLAAYDHQDLPFERLVEALQPDRDPTRNPLAQAMFAMHNAAPFAAELPGLTLRPFQVAAHATVFDLELHLSAEHGQIDGMFRYSTALFDDSTIDRMAQHFRVLVAGALEQPKTRLSQLPVLATGDRHRLLVEWNATDRSDGPPACIDELVAAQAAATPNAIAVRDGERALSYAALTGHAHQLARHLRQRGVGPDARVAILLSRSAEVVIALLATLEAGGAYVPIDPSLPADRIALMLDDSGATVLLTESGLRELAGASTIDVVCVDRDAAEIARHSSGQLDRQSKPDHLAYVLYTSGSTGVPKGVAMHHAALVNLLRWQRARSPAGSEARTLQFGTLSFDQHFLDIFATLTCGGTVYIVTEELRRDPAALLRYLEREDITRMFMPYVALRQLAEVAGEIGSVPQGLQLVIVAGEALQVTAAIRGFFGQLPQCVLCNQYGPAETHVVTALDLTAPAAEWPASPAIGRPIFNTRVYLLDEHLQPVPQGAAGELFIAGDQVARGYLDRAALTAARFVPDPFGPAGTRLYRTGDLARYRQDGALEFLGRADLQFKIRGYRVEPGEVEAAAMRHGDVRHAVAVARDDGAGRRLVLYVVPGDHRDIDVDRVRAHLAGQLPDYMVPAAIVLLDQLPLTAIGKVDRAALPAPDRHATDGTYVGPRNGTEEVLCAVWQDVLGLERTGVHDNFFELGGHSLLATQLVSRIRTTLGRELPVRDLFDFPTIARLAERMTAADTRAAAPPVRRRDPAVPVPLSMGQQRMWFVEQMAVGGAFNMPLALRMRGPLQSAVLRDSLRELIRRHEILRTNIAVAGDVPEQRVRDVADLPWSELDLGSLTPERQQHELARIADAEAQRPFDFERDLLLRAQVLRLGDDDHVLLLTTHHIAFDGWSAGVLFAELTQLYSSFSRGDASPLPELEIQYADFALWQRSWLTSDALEQQLVYWRRQLAALTPLDLPADRQRPAIQTYAGAVHGFFVPAPLVAAMRELGQAEGVTQAMILLAAWQAVLSRYSGQDDIAIGSPIANRTHREFEPLIGYFVNMLVMRTDLSGDPCFTDLLRRVRDVSFGAYEHQDIPFERIVDELKPERDLSRHPLFQVMFAMQNAPEAELRLAELELEVLPLQHEPTKLDLEIHARDLDGGVHIQLIYNQDLFDHATVERMAGHLLRLLEQVTVEPERPLHQLSLLTDSERQQLLFTFNDTAVAYPRDRCLHELFERQAQQAPQATAVVCGGRRLSYAELDRQANRIAHALRDRGVVRGDLVGICVERSLEMVVALVAVLKAGAAYVPLDPQYPTDRLRYMIDDAGVSVLVAVSGIAQSIPDSGAATLWLDHTAQFDGFPTTSPDAGATSLDLCYVIYTSGSTGPPKAVALDHTGRVNNFLDFNRRFAVGAGDAILALSSPSFDMCAYDVFGTLAAGATIVVPEPADLQQPGAWARLMNVHGVSLWHSVPALLKLLVEHVESHPQEAPAALRLVLLGGDWIPVSLPDRLRAVAGDVRIISMGGATECSMDSTMFEIGAVDPASKSIPYGAPMANQLAYVLDQRRQPVPIGIPGELYLGGAGVGRGYLGRPALTAEKFVPDDFATDPQARMYATGDLARWRPDGNLELLGRIDHQVKLRGYRVELGEIEAALRDHDQVAEAVVVCHAEGASKQLVGYVVARAPAGDDLAESVRNAVAQRLPDYMVPAVIVPLTALPLTPNGKIDRKSLPLPQLLSPPGTRVAPDNDVERTLVQIWSELLQSEQIGTRDNFFRLGGDSILSIQVVSRARDRGYALTPQQVFQHQTIAELAGVASAVAANGDGILATPETPFPLAGLDPATIEQRLAPYRRDLIEDVYALSPMQLGIMVHCLGDPDPAAYVLQIRQGLAGFDRDHYIAAWQLAIDRHPVLRTAIIGGAQAEPLQLVWRHAEVPISRHECQGSNQQEQEAWIDRLMADDLRRGIDLTAPVPMRLSLIDRGPRQFECIWTFHHVALDGWSLPLVLRDVIDCYEALCRGDQPAPTRSRPFRDYIAWLQHRDLDAAKQYWQHALAGFSEPTLLSGGHAGTIDGGADGYGDVRVPVPATVVRRLRQIAQDQALTLNTITTGAWALLHAQHTGTDDVVFGATVSGRPAELSGVEDIVGLFINTLPVRVRVAQGPVIDWLRDLQDQQSEQRRYDYSPLWLVQQWSDVSAATPLLDVVFVFENYPVAATTVQRWTDREVTWGHSTQRTGYPLTVSVHVADELEVAFEYQRSAFSAAEIEQLGRQYAALLERLAADPQATPTRLTAIPEQLRHQLLVEWNRTDRDAPDTACIHQLFERQAVAGVERTAVVCGSDQLTYDQLNRRANRLAQELRARGVRPGALVGVMLERDLELPVALLAVLKAGAAYVPLDPDFPIERIRFMVADSGLQVLLSRTAIIADRDLGAPTLCLDARAATIAAHGDANVEDAAAPDSLAYVIYTSGSTGLPKGVAVPHRAVVNLLTSMAAQPGLTADDRLLSVTTVSFDIAALELFLPLLRGACVEIAPAALAADGHRLSRHLADPAITVMQATPATWQMLVDAGWPGSPGLRLLCGGEALPRPLARELLARGAELWNLYGPTETTIWSTIERVTPAEGAVPIGRPIANTRVYVLDPAGEPTPIGVPGELFIGGCGVARGYLGRPSLTAERFVADPFAATPARMYRTGDLVRYLPDGRIEFLGRADTQVKLRGHRIELGEIEAVALAQLEVRQAVAVVREDRPGDQRLVMYVVPGHSRATATEMRQRLATRLPDSMLPSAYVVLDELPMTANRKIDRRALPPPEIDRAALAGSYAAPRSETEKTLCDIWQEILAVDQVGIHDDFFELGGHSLLALKATARIQQECRVEFGLHRFLTSRSVAAAAAEIDALSWAMAARAEDSLGVSPETEEGTL